VNREHQRRPVWVAVAGCGAVGSALVTLLQEQIAAAGASPTLELVRVLVRNPARSRPVPLGRTLVTKSVDEFLETPADVVIEAINTSGQATLTASVSRVDAADTAAAAGRVGTPMEIAWANHGAALDSAALIAALGTRTIASGQIDSGMPGPVREIKVDSGTTSLRVSVAPADSGPDLDLYLFDCTQGPCYLWNLDHSSASRKAILVRDPRPGKWKAVIDPAHIPSGRAVYTYTEIQTTPRLGAATVTTGASPRRLDEHWVDSLVVRLATEPRSRVELIAVADLVDEGAEAAEQTRPLAVFQGARYRPAVIATAVIPLN
jgi:hypothetical protein